MRRCLLPLMGPERVPFGITEPIEYIPRDGCETFGDEFIERQSISSCRRHAGSTARPEPEVSVGDPGRDRALRGDSFYLLVRDLVWKTALGFKDGGISARSEQTSQRPARAGANRQSHYGWRSGGQAVLSGGYLRFTSRAAGGS